MPGVVSHEYKSQTNRIPAPCDSKNAVMVSSHSPRVQSFYLSQETGAAPELCVTFRKLPVLKSTSGYGPTSEIPEQIWGFSGSRQAVRKPIPATWLLLCCAPAGLDEHVTVPWCSGLFGRRSQKIIGKEAGT